MKMFKWVKEIRSKNGILHFKRYAIIETTYFSVYWHKIYEHDRDVHMHSHPWAFFGIIIKGTYVEEYLNKTTVGSILNPIGISLSTAYRTKRPFGIGFGSRKYFHRIHRIENGPVTSLFFTFGKRQNWYYRTSLGKNGLVESEEYRKLKHDKKL
jgi:hypothetical protein